MAEFVEFSVHSRERLRDLERIVVELRREKGSDRRRRVEELEALFDAEASSRLLWPTGPERARRRHDLATRPVIEIPTDQTVGLRWDLDSLVHAVMEGEYELLGCEPAAAGKARLEFRALAYPYGGVGALVALVEAFGFTVTGIDDGTGYLPVGVERR
jgi:hypothetical protein